MSGFVLGLFCRLSSSGYEVAEMAADAIANKLLNLLCLSINVTAKAT